MEVTVLVGYTIEQHEFLERVFNMLREYSTEAHRISNLYITKLSDFQFSSQEIAVLLIINKAVFQNLSAYQYLVEERLLFPAFNSLRMAMEAMRLLRVTIQDEEFRNAYIHNDNLDPSTRDQDFMQRKVNDLLEKLHTDHMAKPIRTESPKIANRLFMKGSLFSGIHSELSKWSHLLNVNYIMPANCNEDSIYLGITSGVSLNEFAQTFIKKYTEAALNFLIDYMLDLSLGIKDTKYSASLDNCFSILREYAEKIYRNK